jgi:hypothetical protein
MNEMVQVKGCPTQQREGQGITVTVGTAVTIRITVIGLTITIGSHFCAAVTSSYAGCLPPMKSCNR